MRRPRILALASATAIGLLALTGLQGAASAHENDRARSSRVERPDHDRRSSHDSRRDHDSRRNNDHDRR